MTDAWTLPSSPSPSLEALSPESSSTSALFMGWHITSTLPSRLWDAYVTYLWYYQPNSWVGRVASTFRILAVVLILPVALLTLLDVTSYVIARTLGVVDDVKASTSDAESAADGRHIAAAEVSACIPVPATRAYPLAALSHAPARASEGLAPEDSVERQSVGDEDENGNGGGDGGQGRVSETGVGMSDVVHARASTRGLGQLQIQTGRETQQARTLTRVRSDASPHACYFAGEEALRLAGEGVFSPAVSMPPSPHIPSHTSIENDGRGSGQVSEEEGTALRRRVQGSREDHT